MDDSQHPPAGGGQPPGGYPPPAGGPPGYPPPGDHPYAPPGADPGGYPPGVYGGVPYPMVPARPAGTVHWLRDHRAAVVAIAAAAILALGLLLGPLLFPADVSPPGEADVVVELIDPPDGYDAMIFNEGDEGKNITVIWLFEQEPEADTDSSTEPSL